jgi:polyhydroxyalkanoate synthesis regulator phasin
MNDKTRPEDKIVDGLLALGQIAMGLQEYVSQRVSEKLPKSCCEGSTNSASLKRMIQDEIKAYMGKHNFVTEEELAALRKVVNQLKNKKSPKSK